MIYSLLQALLVLPPDVLLKEALPLMSDSTQYRDRAVIQLKRREQLKAKIPQNANFGLLVDEVQFLNKLLYIILPLLIIL
jgi:hypothetical protein